MPKSSKKRIGIFVYCSSDERKAIKEAARKKRQAVSGFMLDSVITRIGPKPRRQS